MLLLFIISAGSPRWPLPVREPCRPPEWNEALNMNVAEMNKFKFPFFDNSGRHYPECQRVFFLLSAAKIEQGSRDRDELFFSPLVKIAVSPLNFRRNQQEKKPSGTQGKKACGRLVSLAAIFWMSRNALRDIQKTVARETSGRYNGQRSSTLQVKL